MSFEYKEIDEEGHETLEAIEGAEAFNKWMYATILPYTKGDVFEIGSGIGNISRFFLASNQSIFLSDVRDNYCEILRQKFKHSKSLIGVQNVDLVDPDFDTNYADLLDRFDSVYALNVIEHIENDGLAISNANKLLRKGGKLVILVPAFQSLYNRFDKELFHFKRYKKSTLNRLFSSERYTIDKSFYFNALGIIGWYLSGKIMGNKTIPKSQMKIYNLIVPIAKLIDSLLFRSVGLSVVTVATKK